MNWKITLILFLSFSLLSCEKTEKKRTTAPPQPEKLFTLIGYQQSGIDFLNKLRESPEVNVLTFKYFSNGGGVAIGDVNNDNLPDLYLTGNLGPNHLYLNRGNMTFEDITRSSGVDGGRGWTNGATMVDINNDGLLDIYVCRSGKFPDEMRANQLFVNNGDLTFSEKAAEYGLADQSYSTQAAFFDYDRDGDLDMYLLNHNVSLPENLPLETLKNSEDPLVGDKLYRNDNGHYNNVSKEAGIIGNAIGYGLGVGVGDLNSDGWPDIYVCNDFMEQDYLYLNNGNGTFSEQLKSQVQHTSNFAMGCDLADYNNDGLLDILVTDMAAEDNFRSKTNMSGMNPEAFWKAVNNGFHFQYMVNTLQLNRGDARFSEVGQLAGISYTDWSWAPLFADFDLDGNKDIFITNGYRKASRNNDFIKKKNEAYRYLEQNPGADANAVIAKLLQMMPEDKLPNYIYKNNGDLTFTKKIQEWGLDVLSFSNGAALGDLDNDGDLDIVINNIDQPVQLYRNNARQQNTGHYLKVKLHGPEGNIHGLGAKLFLSSGAMQQFIEFNPSRGYLSCMENLVHFGLPGEGKIDTLRVVWPDQREEILTSVKADMTLELFYKNAGQARPAQSQPNPLFADATRSAGIDFVHKENTFDDFAREILLPHKMSTLGPGMAVGDVNQDGLEDFFVGGAKGQASALYLQGPGQRFSKHMQSMWNQEKAHEDMAAAFFDLEGDGDLDLYVVSGGYDFAEEDPALQDRLYINDGKGNFRKETKLLPPMPSSGSCVLPFDYDGDGDLDLFVGGRVIPGKYPFPANSYLLNNDGGTFTDVTASAAPQLTEAGMVTSAVATDLDGDGQPELILAGEWMPITVLSNRNGSFQRMEAPAGLENSQGWWYSLTSADIDGDGDADLLAGNLGLNYKYKASPDEPFHVYCHDFDENGSLDIYLSYSKAGIQLPVRGRECSSQQLPYIKEKFKTYNEFGQASVPEILGEAMQNALHYEAKTFASAWIENLGNGAFAMHTLPVETQFSSVNGMVLRDVNGDGHSDLMLAGNLYGSEVETTRNDAGLGLLMLGDGKGGFVSQPLTRSGFLADGDVKALAAIRLGESGWGVLVAKNNGPMQLLRLERETSGGMALR